MSKETWREKKMLLSELDKEPEISEDEENNKPEPDRTQSPRTSVDRTSANAANRELDSRISEDRESVASSLSDYRGSMTSLSGHLESVASSSLGYRESVASSSLGYRESVASSSSGYRTSVASLSSGHRGSVASSSSDNRDVTVDNKSTHREMTVIREDVGPSESREIPGGLLPENEGLHRRASKDIQLEEQEPLLDVQQQEQQTQVTQDEGSPSKSVRFNPKLSLKTVNVETGSMHSITSLMRRERMNRICINMFQCSIYALFTIIVISICFLFRLIKYILSFR